MDIESLAAQEATAATNPAQHNISTNEVKPDSWAIAWSHYVLAGDE